MKIEFHMDDDWEKKLLAQIEPAMNDRANRAERAINALAPTSLGQPIDAIKVDIQRAWRREMDGTLDDANLTAFAEALSEGRAVQIVYTGIDR